MGQVFESYEILYHLSMWSVKIMFRLKVSQENMYGCSICWMRRCHKCRWPKLRPIGNWAMLPQWRKVLGNALDQRKNIIGNKVTSLLKEIAADSGRKFGE